MAERTADRIRVYDADSHVVEPTDLWTSRVPAKYGDLVPHTEWSDARREDVWVIGEKPLYGIGTFAMAGWNEFLPGHPTTLEQADHAAWNARARLARLDEYGTYAQVLYPNLIGFFFGTFLKLQRADLLLACVQAYNDFIAEFAAADPDRLLPMMVLPYWDVELAITEMDRAKRLGLRGIVAAGQLQNAGLPPLRDPHWDPLWAAAEERDLPINFHIGFKVPPDFSDKTNTKFSRVRFAESSAQDFMSAMQEIAEVIFSGILHRFPKLKVVSVESGAGWLPFALEAMDWQWRNTGVHLDHPERGLPSDYFRRQVFATFWFERAALSRVIDGLQDNLMFSTDFPHPTSQTPGPASFAATPAEYAEKVLAGVDETTRRKVLQDNARRVYGLA